MKITIDVPTLLLDNGPSWEKLQDLVRSCLHDERQSTRFVRLVRADGPSGNYRATDGDYIVALVDGEQGFAGSIRVER